MKATHYQQLWKVLKIAAVIETPLFLGLFYRSEILRRGPHDGLTWLLVYPQFIGWMVASMLPMSSVFPPSVVEVLAWIIIFVVQLGFYALVVWALLLLVRRKVVVGE